MEIKLPLHMLPFMGGGIRYGMSTHTHFGIGKVNSSPKRCRLLSYLKLTLTQWLDLEPVPHYNEYIGNLKNVNYWKVVENLNDIKKWWKNEDIEKYVLNDDDITIKGGGSGNWAKSNQLLFNSKQVLKMYIGVGKYYGIFIVSGLRMKMTVVQDKTKIKKG